MQYNMLYTKNYDILYVKKNYHQIFKTYWGGLKVWNSMLYNMLYIMNTFYVTRVKKLITSMIYTMLCNNYHQILKTLWRWA